MNVVNFSGTLSSALLIFPLLLCSLGKINKKKELSALLGISGSGEQSLFEVHEVHKFMARAPAPGPSQVWDRRSTRCRGRAGDATAKEGP